MCKEMLRTNAADRTGVDPISGKALDKAVAIIGAAPDGTVYYFENEANFQQFASDPARYIQPATVDP